MVLVAATIICKYHDASTTYTLLEQSELLLKRSLLCTMNGLLINQLFHERCCTFIARQTLRQLQNKHKHLGDVCV